MDDELLDDEAVAETLGDLIDTVDELQDSVAELEATLATRPKVVMGPIGPKGDSITGPRGPKGDALVGPQGPKGDKGERGDDGTSVILKDVLDELRPEVLNVYKRGGGQANRNIQVDGVNVLTPWTDINLKSGSNASITATPNNTTHYTDITISSSGGGGSGFQTPLSGGLTGTNTWAIAPNVIAVDQGRIMQKVSTDGTINWTGTTTTVLAVAPTFDIYAIS